MSTSTTLVVFSVQSPRGADAPEQPVLLLKSLYKTKFVSYECQSRAAGWSVFFVCVLIEVH